MCDIVRANVITGWSAYGAIVGRPFAGHSEPPFRQTKGLLTEWPEGGPKLVWKTAGAGRGYSSLAIVDGRIYTLGDAPSTADDKDEYLVCFNQADGKQLWKTKTGPAWNTKASPIGKALAARRRSTAIAFMSSPRMAR